MAVVHKFDSQQKSPKTATAAAGGDGGPPMELLERVIKIEATLPSLASKSDIDLIRSDMGVMRNDMSHMATKVEVESLRVAVGNCATKAEVESLRVAVGNCATKAELQALRADFHRDMNLQTWRLIGVCTALVAATYFIAAHFGH
ncbi:MAG: hypothetical protein QM537_06050 [Candidatus Symbiobacter sp.]|nr:hypothetical protein [Candidatus Symbiobacter sp.]